MPRQWKTSIFPCTAGRIFFSKHSAKDEPLLARLPGKISQGREHGRRTNAATAGSAGHSEIIDGVAQGVEGRAGLKVFSRFWSCFFVARELAPAGLRSNPKTCDQTLPDPDTPLCRYLRLLRSRTGASSLATRAPSLQVNRTPKKTPTLNQPSAFETLKGFASRIRTPAVPRRCTSSR